MTQSSVVSLSECAYCSNSYNEYSIDATEMRDRRHRSDCSHRYLSNRTEMNANLYCEIVFTREKSVKLQTYIEEEEKPRVSGD
jgi:hypothetical protein